MYFTTWVEETYHFKEKFKIAGDKPGSGNTENIGSISSLYLDDFKFGKGPFSRLGYEVYDIYWKYYPKYRMNEENAYHSLYEFKGWCASHRTEIETIDSNYDSIIKLIDEYVSAGE